MLKRFSLRTVLQGLLLIASLSWPKVAFTQPQPGDEILRVYAVHVGGLYGVYLGNGLIITAAHVVGGKPDVRVAGLVLPAKVVKTSPFEQLDLALLSIDDKQLPIALRLRRMPICQGPPIVGAPVIVATPEGTAR